MKWTHNELKTIINLRRPIGNLVSYLAPHLPCASASKNVAFPELQLAYDADPNCWCVWLLFFSSLLSL
jgi:hypothetical protein